MIYLFIIKCVVFHCEYVNDSSYRTMLECEQAIEQKQLESGEGAICTDRDIST